MNTFVQETELDDQLYSVKSVNALATTPLSVLALTRYALLLRDPYSDMLTKLRSEARDIGFGRIDHLQQ